ncbi:MAG: hypothetical protein HY553_03240 [Elusimicrobia bacterium]|nr:hypothetical protein [Elusimicrobiota bacterium]
MPWNRKEQEALKTAIGRASMRLGQKVRYDNLLSKWRAFVAEVERGYTWTLQDYQTDLSVRDEIEAVLRAVPASVRRQLSPPLTEADRRFESATAPSDRPVIRGEARDGQWYRRIPKLRVGELRADLTDEGL